MGNQSNFSIMAAEAFCKAVDERCLPGIDLSKALGGLSNVSTQAGAMTQVPQGVQADLDKFIKPDGNTNGIA